ncbi:MAG: aminopeptidase P family N-terminal domain-containing protein, partial [Aquabacterium sp.]|nr:aminopeptidase P family N-terminal domain-containing protein [Aquabacterium sp.]
MGTSFVSMPAVTSNSTNSPIPARLQALRQHAAQQGWQAVLIPSSDPHLSEYLPAHWQGREWFSGFTGSSGTLLVADQRAAVFTDSRYWEQAEAELAGTGVDLVKLDGPAIPAYVAWLQSMAPSGKLAIDGTVMGLAQAKQLQEALAPANWTLQADTDPLLGAWPDRTGLPQAPVFEHALPFASTPRADKLAALRQAMLDKGATHHWVATLDDLAWLLNLRGSDVEYNPVFLGHALIALDSATLFINLDKVTPAVQTSLQKDGVNVVDYAQAVPSLKAIPSTATLLIDPKRVTWGLREAVPAGVKVIESINPTTLAKSRKTEAEAVFIRQAMEQDGAALAEFYAWFEQALGHEHISELTVDERMTAERAKRQGYVSLSFP